MKDKGLQRPLIKKCKQKIFMNWKIIKEYFSIRVPCLKYQAQSLGVFSLFY